MPVIWLVMKLITEIHWLPSKTKKGITANIVNLQILADPGNRIGFFYTR